MNTLLLITCIAGQCSGGNCPSFGPALNYAPIIEQPVHQWRPIGENQFALYLGARQIGFADENGYRVLINPLTKEFGPYTDPPISFPQGLVVKSSELTLEQLRKGTNFGLDRDKIASSTSYTKNGKEVSRGEALRAVSDLPIDKGNLSLTIIGKDADRIKGEIAQSPAMQPFLKTTHIQAYAPDDPMVAKAGFVTSGVPTIYIQNPAGQVLHRQDDYVGGAEAVASAVRKANSSYNPQADPNLNAALPFDLNALLKQPMTLILLGVVLFLLLRNNSPKA